MIRVTGSGQPVTTRDTHGDAPASLSWLAPGAWHGASIQPRAGPSLSSRARPGCENCERTEGGENPTLDTGRPSRSRRLFCVTGCSDIRLLKSKIPPSIWLCDYPICHKNRAEIWVGISVHKTWIWIFGKQFYLRTPKRLGHGAFVELNKFRGQIQATNL